MMTSSAASHIWMIAEDDLALREMMSVVLEFWEIKPLSFRDGREAMAWLDRVEHGEYRDPLPELALLDIRMPGVPGHLVGARMRAVLQTRNIPIIIFTAYALSPDERKLIHDLVRPDLFLNKPLPSIMELRPKLEEVIVKSRERATHTLI
jgi:CheY-like chemotaxis protein